MGTVLGLTHVSQLMSNGEAAIGRQGQTAIGINLFHFYSNSVQQELAEDICPQNEDSLLNFMFLGAQLHQIDDNNLGCPEQLRN